jgi:hypothetical protein
VELILRSDSESSLAKIVALAKKLNVTVEQRDIIAKTYSEREELLNKILNFKAKGESSFGDALEWQIEERK